MRKDIEIAGDKTVKDWLDLKSKIEKDFDNIKLWEQAFAFFEIRIGTRYIAPAEVIQNHHSSQAAGEGFAITAIICTLIEAFESFLQGKNYKYLKKGEKLKKYEYNRSSDIFVDFLTKREPFKQHFHKRRLAQEFYQNVRCSLLHEACTKNGWIIRIDTDKLLEKNGQTYTLNRALLLHLIKEYIPTYKKLLIADNNLKKAFVRKMDYVCEIA
ncbi:hypothetical protein ACLG6S_13685 [Thermodesulfobacteriota bacterium B35]